MRNTTLLFVLLAACGGGGPGGSGDEKVPEEICDNLEDDDLDDLADCADPDCAAVCGEVCNNGTDDDLDGLIDCLDDDCDGLCPEDCDDGRDNDGDGAIDCDDRDCFGSCPEVCGDGFDNDGDGKVDCLDEECVDPSCVEICSDGRDNDADELVDCEDDDCNDPVCDEDCADGRDNDADGRIDCDDTDCDGACPEVCDDGRDNDADGRVDCDDEECAEICDADGDGFFNADFGGDDCDDTRFDVNPSRPEICDGDEVLDNDCDGLFDEEDPDIDPLTLIAWARDVDGDGYGTNVEVELACQQPDGKGFAGTDCDDERADINPSMPEICNVDEPLDDDCDGLVDDADPDVTEDSYLEWFADRDGDGFGADDDFEYACSRPEGTAATNDDCDDADPTVGPPSLWLEDGDGDGFGAGDPFDPVPTCDPPGPGLFPDWIGLDCGPDDPTVYPGAEEICEDGIDQDCDGLDKPCIGELFLAASRYGESGLWAVDTRTGVTRFVGDPRTPITGLTFADDGVLYGVTGGYGGADVYTIDPTTGAAARFGGAAGYGGEAAIADHEGVLYTIDQYTAFGTVDKATGAYTELGYPSGGGESSYGYALASTPSGLIYVNDTNMHLIDPVAGRMTLVGRTGIARDNGGGATMHGGELWFATGDGGGGTALYTIDLVTGAATPSGIVVPEGGIDSMASPTP